MEVITKEEAPDDPGVKSKLSIIDVVHAARPRVKEEIKEGDDHKMAEILEIAGILQHKHAMLTDTLSKEGQPLLVLYENARFSSLTFTEFQHSVHYIIDVAREVWEGRQILIVVDRRKDKWQSVRVALQYLEAVPKSQVHKVLILKPTGFFKKLFGGGDLGQLQQLSHHQITLLESEQALLDYVDESSLPLELSGSQDFDHMEWIEHRTAVERFAITCHKTEDRLKHLKSLFIKRDPLTSIPEIEEIAASHRQMLTDIEEDIRCTKDIAETLETIVVKPLKQREITPLYQYNITCLNRRTKELETLRDDAEATWNEQDKYFEQSLSLCTFEQDFGKVSQEILKATGEVTGRVDVGETMEAAEELMKEFNEFSERTETPHDDIKELHERGRQMLNAGHFARNSIEIRTQEIDKLCSKFEELSRKRRELLQANVDALLCLQQLNSWCKEGVDLLASQPVDRFQSPDGADKALTEIDKFITSQKGISFGKMNKLPSLVRMLDNKLIDEKMKAALKRMEEVKEMFSKRENSLKKISSKPERPVQPVVPQSVGKVEALDVNNKKAPERVRRKSDEGLPGRERKNIEILVSAQPQRPKRNLSLRRSLRLKKKPSLDDQGEEAIMARKMRQVVRELVETEYDYVEDLQFVVEGYYKNFEDATNDIPNYIRSKKHVVFGNIVEIYDFHQNIFLKELKEYDNASSSIGKIFTSKKEYFQLYEAYCRNKPASEGLRLELQNTQYVKGCQTKLGHQLPLDSYLLKPVQRITKYQLLIQEMMKYTNKKSSSYQDLVEALDTMKKVLRHLNDVMHSSGLVGYVGNKNDLGKLILQDTFVVWELHKNMLKQISNLRGKHRQVFLYENAVVLSKKELRELENGKEAYVYQFKDRLDIHEVRLTEQVKSDPCKFELTVKRGKEIHVMQAKSEDIKKCWVEEVRSLLLRQLDIAKEKLGLRSQKIPMLQGLNLETSTRTSAPNIPLLLSPDQPEASVSADTAKRKFSFNNAISTPKLEESLGSLGVRSLTPEMRSSSENRLWTGDDSRPSTLYLSPAPEYDGESDEMWSDNEFDYMPDEFDDVEQSMASSCSDGDQRSQGSLRSREVYSAVADYVAVEPTEISFQAGDALELLEYGEDGWWFVENAADGTQGWAPASYMEPQGKGINKGNDGVQAKPVLLQNGNSVRLETTV